MKQPNIFPYNFELPQKRLPERDVRSNTKFCILNQTRKDCGGELDIFVNVCFATTVCTNPPVVPLVFAAIPAPVSSRSPVYHIDTINQCGVCYKRLLFLFSFIWPNLHDRSLCFTNLTKENCLLHLIVKQTV